MDKYCGLTVGLYAGNPLSILDGIFIAIKDDIDCHPHPSKGKQILGSDLVCVIKETCLDYLLMTGRWIYMDA
jgi:Na+/H+ antiporter NhaA